MTEKFKNKLVLAFMLAFAAVTVPILAHADANQLINTASQNMDTGVGFFKKLLGYIFDAIALVGGGAMALGGLKFKDRFQDGQPDPKATKEAAWKIGGGFITLVMIYALRQAFPALPSFLGMA